MGESLGSGWARNILYNMVRGLCGSSAGLAVRGLELHLGTGIVGFDLDVLVSGFARRTAHDD